MEYIGKMNVSSVLGLPVITFFLLSIGFEWLYGHIRKRNTYSLNDTISSLSTGLLYRCRTLFFIGINALVLTFLENKIALWHMDPGALGTWIFAFVAYDFCYYWGHRIGHERQFFWASHVVHHQSEHFNLSTALRQPTSGILITWLKFLPLILVGVPAEVYIPIYLINLTYQFWVHTEHIPKLGWYEWIFVTPSNHRVHHGQNEIYIDRNYGGVFIIWDRLFGSFQEELDHTPVIYGIREPIKTFNPLWANVHIFIGMLQDAWRTRKWKDKWKVLISRTGWRPSDTAKKWPRLKSNLENFQKYNPPISSLVSCYAFIQFSAIMLADTALFVILTIHTGKTPNYELSALLLGMMLLTMLCTAYWFKGSKPILLEVLRVSLLFAWAYFSWNSPLYSPAISLGVFAYAFFNLIFLSFLSHSDKFSKLLPWTSWSFLKKNRF